MSLAVSADSTARLRDFAVDGAICELQSPIEKHAAGTCSATTLVGRVQLQCESLLGAECLNIRHTCLQGDLMSSSTVHCPCLCVD